MIVLIDTYPTPYHAPALNRLHQELDDELRVFYLHGTEPLDPTLYHGWGDVQVTHPYTALDSPRGWSALAAALRSPDLRAVCLYHHRGLARKVSALAARVRGVPLVLRGTANIHDELRRPALRRIVKRAYLRTMLGQPEVWTTGSANEAYWRLMGMRNLHTVPNVLEHLPSGASDGPAMREELDLKGRFVFAYVGRLEPHKGVMDLLAAYDLVRRSTPRAATALVITGRGTLDSDVRRYVDAHDDCRYPGPIPQERLGAVYAAADVIVIPSHSEPWCWVVNEARGHGTRFIASTAVGAADDHCTDVTGRRCPVADPPGLADAMLAEYRLGPRAAPRLEYVDTVRPIADRLAALAREVASPVKA